MTLPAVLLVAAVVAAVCWLFCFLLVLVCSFWLLPFGLVDVLDIVAAVAVMLPFAFDVL